MNNIKKVIQFPLTFLFFTIGFYFWISYYPGMFSKDSFFFLNKLFVENLPLGELSRESILYQFLFKLFITKENLIAHLTFAQLFLTSTGIFLFEFIALKKLNNKLSPLMLLFLIPSFYFIVSTEREVWYAAFQLLFLCFYFLYLYSYDLKNLIFATLFACVSYSLKGQGLILLICLFLVFLKLKMKNNIENKDVLFFFISIFLFFSLDFLITYKVKTPRYYELKRYDQSFKLIHVAKELINEEKITISDETKKEIFPYIDSSFFDIEERTLPNLNYKTSLELKNLWKLNFYIISKNPFTFIKHQLKKIYKTFKSPILQLPPRGYQEHLIENIPSLKSLRYGLFHDLRKPLNSFRESFDSSFILLKLLFWSPLLAFSFIFFGAFYFFKKNKQLATYLIFPFFVEIIFVIIVYPVNYEIKYLFNQMFIFLPLLYFSIHSNKKFIND